MDVASRRPALVLALTVLLTAGAVVGVTRVEPQVDFVDAVPDHPGLGPYREMLERLDGVRFVAVYMAHDPSHASGDLRQDEGFDALVREQEDLTRFLEGRFPGAFSHSLSVYEGMKAGNHMLQKTATLGDPPEGSYSLPDDPLTWQAVRDRGLEEGDFDDVLAADGSSALALFFFTTKDNLEARELSGDVAAALDDWQPPEGATTDHQASGLLYSSHYTDERNAQDIPYWATVALAAVGIALLWVVRRPTNVLLALAGVAVATVWTFGALGWMGLRLSFLSLFLAPVVSGIGVDFAVHLLHRVEEERDAGTRHPVRRALCTTGPAVALAGVTTATGLATMLLVPAPLFSEIGGVAALGILFGLLAALTVVPALRTVLPGRRRPRRDRVGPTVARWARTVRRRPALPLAAVLLASLAATAVVATQTEVESGSAENEFPQDDPVIRLQHRIEEEYGAFQRAYLIVQGDMRDPEALQALWRASQDAAGLPLHRGASSVADLLLADEATDDGAADMALASVLEPAGQRPSETDRLPQTRAEAQDRLDALYEDPLWRTLAPFTITRDYDLAVVAITLEPWEDQAALRALRDALEALAAGIDADLAFHDVSAAGAPVNRAAVIEQTPWDVAIATLGAALAVGAVLAVAWRKRGASGLRVAGLATGIVLLAALWLLASVPLLDGAYDLLGTFNSATLTDMFLLAFAITVAVGVDDVVHIASRFWEARDRGLGRDAALREAFTHAGRAVTGTTATTFVAFAVLAGVYFLQSKNLAILTAAGVLYAYLLTMLLLPVVLGARAQTDSDAVRERSVRDGAAAKPPARRGAVPEPPAPRGALPERAG